MRSREYVCPAAGGTHQGWSRVISTLILAVITSAFTACSMGYGELEIPEDSPANAKPASLGQVKPKESSLLTGITSLIDNQSEATGYGLYSYVLFESPPTAETKPVYLAVISACLKEIPALGGLAKQNRPESLNALYIPITKDIAEPKAEEILQRYNYRRAQTILNQLPKNLRNGGPYLISSLAPASQSDRMSLSLFQDLSAIRLVFSQNDQTNIAYEWVLDFVRQVSTPQPTGWDRTTLATFSGEIREARQIAFNRSGVHADRLDLKKYIVFPIPDNRTEQISPFLAWRTSVGKGGRNHITIPEQ